MALPTNGIDRRLQLAALTVAALCMLHEARAEVTVDSLTGGSVTGVGPHYQDLLDAIRKSASRDFAGAMAHLENAKKNTPRLPPPEVMMAQLYFEANQPALAFGSLEKAIARVPQDPEALVALAERAVRDGRATDATLLTDRALKVNEKFNENPRRKQLLQMRLLNVGASADEAASNWAEAQRKLEETLKLEPKDSATRQRLARALFKQGKQKEAYAEFQAAGEADPALPPAELSMALLTTDPVRADQWLKLAVEKGGNNVRTRLTAAEFALRANQLPDAKQHIDAALAIEPEGLAANNIAGMVARMAGDYSSAEKYLAKAHLLSPSDPAIINHLALVLIESSNKADQQRGQQYAELGARLRPNDPEAIATLGWVYFKLGRAPEAEQAFNMVINSGAAGGRGSVNPEMAYYLANLAHQRARTVEAVRLLTEALNNNQPFMYRKPAGELLAELQKMVPADATKSGAPKSGSGK